MFENFKIKSPINEYFMRDISYFVLVEFSLILVNIFG